MHFHALIHIASLWAVKTVAGPLFIYVLRAAWKVVIGWFSSFGQLTTLPALTVSFPIVQASRRMYSVIRYVGIVLLVVAVIGGVVFAFRRGARIPLPTAC
jgi:hypothetical protein